MQLMCMYVWDDKYPSDALEMCATLKVDKDLGDMLPVTIIREEEFLQSYFCHDDKLHYNSSSQVYTRRCRWTRTCATCWCGQTRRRPRPSACACGPRPSRSSTSRIWTPCRRGAHCSPTRQHFVFKHVRRCNVKRLLRRLWPAAGCFGQLRVGSSKEWLRAGRAFLPGWLCAPCTEVARHKYVL
jgi:hypothetical protein